jgi:ArsR family transcriptional regulator
MASNTFSKASMNPTANNPAASKKPVLTRARRTAILKALADPKRFELLERIARASCPLGCSDVLPALAISPATLSHHIKELQNAGLIQVTRAGKFHFLSLRVGMLDAFIASLARLRPEDCGTQKTLSS